jgi:hypothetical protein
VAAGTDSTAAVDRKTAAAEAGRPVATDTPAAEIDTLAVAGADTAAAAVAGADRPAAAVVPGRLAVAAQEGTPVGQGGTVVTGDSWAWADPQLEAGLNIHTTFDSYLYCRIHVISNPFVLGLLCSRLSDNVSLDRVLIVLSSIYQNKLRSTDVSIYLY